MGFINYDVNRYTPKQMVAIPLVLLILSLRCSATRSHHRYAGNTGMDFSGGRLSRYLLLTPLTASVPLSPDILWSVSEKESVMGNI